MSEENEVTECPICLDELNSSDRNCRCGYKLCRFCWNHISENLNGRCPACRQPYKSDLLKPSPNEAKSQMVKQVMAAKEREGKNRSGLPAAEATSKKQFSDVRVIQRNLVYVTNLALSAAKEETLRRQEYFGKFGKIVKIVINKSHVYSGPQGPSVSAYITYTSNAHAHAAIKAMDGTVADGRVLRASFGTTKYCTYFLRGVRCPNPDCMYLHDVGATVDSFTKEDMAQGKHLLSNKPAVPAQPATGSTAAGASGAPLKSVPITAKKATNTMAWKTVVTGAASSPTSNNAEAMKKDLSNSDPEQNRGNVESNKTNPIDGNKSNVRNDENTDNSKEVEDRNWEQFQMEEGERAQNEADWEQHEHNSTDSNDGANNDNNTSSNDVDSYSQSPTNESPITEHDKTQSHSEQSIQTNTTSECTNGLLAGQSLPSDATIDIPSSVGITFEEWLRDKFSDFLSGDHSPHTTLENLNKIASPLSLSSEGITENSSDDGILFDPSFLRTLRQTSHSRFSFAQPHQQKYHQSQRQQIQPLMEIQQTSVRLNDLRLEPQHMHPTALHQMPTQSQVVYANHYHPQLHQQQQQQQQQQKQQHYLHQQQQQQMQQMQQMQHLQHMQMRHMQQLRQQQQMVSVHQGQVGADIKLLSTTQRTNGDSGVSEIGVFNF